MPARIVVLGGGVGGTLAGNLLSKELGRDARVTVVDPTGMHVYQPGFLYVALGQANSRWLARDERTLLRRDVELAVESAVRVDSAEGTVQLARGGSLPFDYLVIATGARLVYDTVPGLREGSYEFYSLDGAQRLREALRSFQGGRVLVGIAGIPYKCPPAPVEFVFMVEEYLRKRGLRDRSEITLLSPLNRAFTIESASKLIQPIMEERGIGLSTFFNVEAVDSSAALLGVLFIAALFQAKARGLQIDCGCFGGGGPGDGVSSWDIARDVPMVLCGLYLAARPEGPVQLGDRFREMEVDDGQDDATNEEADQARAETSRR